MGTCLQIFQEEAEENGWKRRRRTGEGKNTNASAA
jgi:hypothetical protein